MKFVYQAKLLSIFFAFSLAGGQEHTKPASQPGPAPLELKLTKGPLWKGNCLELSVQRTNLSKLSIFLDATYDGLKVYTSVSHAINIPGQGPVEAWMLVYGWTDVISEPLQLGPGATRQNTLCITETFPVKETGKEIPRQVRVQGKLRIVAGYEIPTWKIVDQSLGEGRRAYVRVAENSNHWTSGEVVLEIPIPCPNGIGASDCLSPSQIFPGEHDVHAIEIEPPPAMEVQPPPPPLPTLLIDSPFPPKP